MRAGARAAAEEGGAGCARTREHGAAAAPAPTPVEVGDRALRFEVPPDVDGAALLGALRVLSGVADACVTEAHALVVFDGAPPELASALEAARRGEGSPGREHVVDVVLDGADVTEVVRTAGLGGADELGRLLADAPLRVSFLGFTPGFAYLRGLDPRLSALERRAVPRTVVPAGSVALAGGYLGIYPSPTPGGWNLVGRTGHRLVGPEHAVLRSGDRVRLRIVPALGDEPVAAASRSGAASARRRLVVRAHGPVWVQDLGRPGLLSEGVPRGGALVPEALVRANRLAGAADGAPALERFGPLALTAEVDARLATDDGEVVEVKAGASASFGWGPGRRAGYVAVRGGLEVPRVLGGHGTHVSARLGGHEGRPLRTGDVLFVGDRHAPVRGEARTRSGPQADAGGSPAPPSAAAPRVLEVVPGPDAELCGEGALARLLETEWRIAPESDRTGVRLSGGTIALRAGARLRSVPLVPGAIEVTPSGLPIVLGPDHPTTGGYPVVAVVARADHAAIFGAPVGARVRFVETTAAAARARSAS